MKRLQVSNRSHGELGHQERQGPIERRGGSGGRVAGVGVARAVQPRRGRNGDAGQGADGSRAAGLRPHLAERALASGRSRTLGLSAPTFANPIYATFIQAAQRAANARGLQIPEQMSVTGIDDAGYAGLMTGPMRDLDPPWIVEGRRTDEFVAGW